MNKSWNKELSQQIVGKTTQEANDILKDSKLFIRIREENGIPSFVTMEERGDRVDVKVVDDRITEVIGIS